MGKKAGFLFETSWEVCNKVGGIHTVITSKLPSMYNEFGDNMIFIGPDFIRDDFAQPEFIEDKTLFADWKCNLGFSNIRIKTGRWNVAHKPYAILIDFSGLVPQKDEIFAHFWEKYKLDSLSGSWEYVESALFGWCYMFDFQKN